MTSITNNAELSASIEQEPIQLSATVNTSPPEISAQITTQEDNLSSEITTRTHPVFVSVGEVGIRGKQGEKGDTGGVYGVSSLSDNEIQIINDEMYVAPPADFNYSEYIGTLLS